MLNVNIEGVNLELKFSELSAEIQKSIYLQDKKKFELEAAASQYEQVRRAVISSKDTSQEILESIFELELNVFKNKENILALLAHPNLRKKEEKKNLIVEKHIIEICFHFLYEEESSSELLNNLLIKEIEMSKFDHTLLKCMFNNKKFKLEERTLRIIAHHSQWSVRYEAILAIKDSENLNYMFEEELNGDENVYVIEALLANEYLQLDKEKRILLYKKNYAVSIKSKLARSEKADSQELNEYLQFELKRRNSNYSIVDLILENKNFKMELENLQLMASADFPDERRRVFKYEDMLTLEFLENMYIKEDDEDIRWKIEELVINMYPKNLVKVNMIKKIKILEILKDLRNDTHKKPLAIYLKDILEVLK